MKIPDLSQETYRLIRQIPEGQVSTPRDISEALGDIKATKVVIEIIKNMNPSYMSSINRVVSKTGKPIHPFKSGIYCLRTRKEEGLETKVNTENFLGAQLFKDFKTDSPLKRLKEIQEKLSKEVILNDLSGGPIDVVAGVDIAYKKGEGFSVCVLMDTCFNILEEVNVNAEVSFPYISSYLAFREGPLIMKVLERVKGSYQILMLNGQGLAHPRGCGLSSQIGIIIGDKPTIGVTTRKLIGEVERRGLCSPLKYRNRIVGAEVRREGHGPIYISPGNNITLKRSIKIVKTYMGEHRLPEPLWWAHKKSRNLSRCR